MNVTNKYWLLTIYGNKNNCSQKVNICIQGVITCDIYIMEYELDTWYDIDMIVLTKYHSFQPTELVCKI